MKTISLLFVVHQPLRLKTYRFFDMGRDHNYLDDAANRTLMGNAARQCYLPMNRLLTESIERHKGKFRVSFYISGIALEQLRAFAPAALESFRALADTGYVEFVAGSYSNSLSALADDDEFRDDVKLHCDMVEEVFGRRPTTFCNTAMLYSDRIGGLVADMGFDAMVTEGAKHVLGWKSPDYVYAAAEDHKLHLLLRNNRLSDDIAFRFSDRNWSGWPLTAEKFAGWMAGETTGHVITLAMDYDALGGWQRAESGIFDFMAALPQAALDTGALQFDTLSSTAACNRPEGVLNSHYPITWADEERDISAWLGNELQSEAFKLLYAQREKVRALDSADFDHPWRFLQTANHFYWMGTKWFSQGDLQSNSNPYSSSYEAFINYMNVLNDFIIELDRALSRRSRAATAHRTAEATVCSV
jgi:alpha-amylase